MPAVARRGCRRPDPLRYDARPHAASHPVIRARLDAHASGASPLAPSADKLPPHPRADQGRSGSCTWGALSIAMFVAFVSKGIPLGFVPSQRVGYGVTRAIERAAATSAGDKLPPLDDSGADPEDGFTAAAEYGVEPMKCSQTPDGRFYDLWTDDDIRGLASAPPANVNAEPDVSDLEEARATRVKIEAATHAIPPNDPNVSDLLAAALDASTPLPVYACGQVGQNLDNAQPGQVIGPVDPNDSTAGGHAYWISAYRTNPVTGEREWKLENSWGAWCDSGTCWVSLAFIKAQWGMWILDPKILSEAA